MFKIIKMVSLNTNVKLMEVEAPLIAKKIKPGQFIMLRIDSYGERVPFTVAVTNPQEGTVTVIFQEAGKTTKQLGTLKSGDSILNFVGPLGMPTELDGTKKSCRYRGRFGLCNSISARKETF